MTEQGYHRITPETGELYGVVRVNLDADGRYSTDALAKAVQVADDLAAAQVSERGCSLKYVSVRVGHVVEMMS